MMTRIYSAARQISPFLFAGLAFLAAIAIDNEAFGQTGNAPSYEAGTTFVFDNGTVERFTGGAGNELLWRSRSGREYTRSRDFFVPILSWRTSRSQGARVVNGDPSKVWPLEQRRRARFSVVTTSRSRGAGEDWDEAELNRSVALWRCRAGRPQLLAVPAGEFESTAIVCERYSSSSMRVLRRLTWYYAPAVGHYIRREEINYSTGEHAERNLVAALPLAQANDARIDAILANY